MELKQIIKLYQELANNAWPCKHHFFVKGWDVRISEGYTQRANSVLPISYFGRHPEKDIALVEQIYQKMKLVRAIFQIPEFTSPTNLDLILHSLGYRQRSKTSVMSVKLKDLSNVNYDQKFLYKVSNLDLKDHWFDFKRSLSSHISKMHLKKLIIDRIQIPEKLFFYLYSNELLIGVALGVNERGYLGVYDVEIHPEFRNKGHGTNLMSFIIDWARKKALSVIYLQVETKNEAGQRLYNELGFYTLFHYHYREKTLI
ncbi:MAG: GNAT family N-acetyltransferase [Candidatus Hodarchaeales archaeon]